MDDFLQSLRRELEGQEAPPFNEGSWRRMQRRLRRRPMYRNRGLWLALLLLLLPLLWLLWQYGPAPAADQHTVEVIADTVYRTRVIYRTDTVYLSGRTYRPALPHWAGLSMHRPAFPNSFQPAVDFSAPFAISHLRSGAGGSAVGTATASPAGRAAAGTGQLPLPDFRVSHPERPDLRDYASLPLTAFERRSRWLTRLLHRVEPAGVRLGLAGGYFYPSYAGLGEERGLGAALQASLVLSDRFDLRWEMGYADLLYQTSLSDDRLGIPVAAPPAPQLVFREVSVRQPALQFELGIHYRQPVRGRWHPFAELAYGAVDLMTAEAIYEFEDPATGQEVLLERNVSDNRLVYQQLIGKAGIGYRPGARWTWELSAQWRRTISRQEPQFFDIIGLRTSLLYRLGG